MGTTSQRLFQFLVVQMFGWSPDKQQLHCLLRFEKVPVKETKKFL